MIEIIPAIIPKSLKDLENNLEKIIGFVERVQVDVLDGKYTPEPSWPYTNNFADFSQFESQEKGLPFWEDLDFEFDLMVKNPEKELLKYASAGAKAVIIHLESTENIDDTIEVARECGLEVGLAFKPSTSLETIYPLLENVDFIQVMGNDKIGFHGVTLDEKVFEILRDLRGRTDLPLGVDIGVNLDTAPKLIGAGASRLASGSTIFKSEDVGEVVERLGDRESL
jgi:ribulose-phosphate 3-epimerase